MKKIEEEFLKIVVHNMFKPDGLISSGTAEKVAEQCCLKYQEMINEKLEIIKRIVIENYIYNPKTEHNFELIIEEINNSME